MISKEKDSNRLVFNITVFNACVAAFAAWAWQMGYIRLIFESERTGIGYGLVVLFFVGLAGLYRRALKVSRALNELKTGTQIDASKFAIKNGFLNNVPRWLVSVGLIGNLIGFFIALNAVNLGGSIEEMVKSINSAMAGMKLSFLNTLLGLSLALVYQFSAALLKTATELLMVDARK